MPTKTPFRRRAPRLYDRAQERIHLLRRMLENPHTNPKLRPAIEKAYMDSVRRSVDGMMSRRR